MNKKRFARFAAVCLVAVAVLLPQIIGADSTSSFNGNLALCKRIPPRPLNAITGSEFARRTDGMKEEQRQQAALVELRKGNIPSFLRELKPVKLSGQSANGKKIDVIIWVMPDYLAIGSDRDFLRIPLNYPTAVEIADEFGFVLPTDKIVDAIYEQSTVHLDPHPLPAGERMCSNEYYLYHQRIIQRQLYGHCGGELTAGHKKDVVLTNRLVDHPGKIAIYGWHRRNGEPIQPLSTVHQAAYADYSHGIRLVGATALVNGKPRAILDLLQDENLAPVISNEGAIANAPELMHCRLQ